MSASGEMGTLNPPSDNDDVAEVTPLRRRDARLVAVPTVRDPLPAENSVWDTDEPGEPRLRRTNRRRVRSALTLGWRAVRDRVRVPPRVGLGAGIGLACFAAVIAFTQGFTSQPISRPHPTVASSLVPDSSSSGKLSTAAASSTHRVAGSPLRATGHRASHRSGRIILHRRTRVAPREAARKKSGAQRPIAAQSTRSTAAKLTTAPSTPVTSPTYSTTTTAAATSATSNATSASRPKGPTGTGAAFGPGY